MMIRYGGCSTQAPKRVMLVDDHPAIRRGLKALIDAADGWEVCAEASEGHEAISVATKAQPDVVVMDLSLPTIGGIDATAQVRKLLPDVEVLILTMHESDNLVSQALRAGARGYLLKSESEDRMIDGLKALCRHQPYFSPTVSETLLKGYLTSAPSADPKQLTPRERQIVKLVAEGKTNKGIALLLRVSVKTVETHRSSAMRKVGAKSSADLTLYAARNELVQL